MNRITPGPETEETAIHTQDVDPAVLDAEVIAIAVSRSRLDAFAAAALRARVWGARRVLAHGIDPRLSLAELLAEVRSSPAERLAKTALARRAQDVPAEAVPRWWRALARVIALQGLDQSDRQDGLRLYDIARVMAPVTSWTTGDAQTYAQLLWSTGDRPRLRADRDLIAALDIEDRHSLAVDLAADAKGIPSTEWTDALARMLGPVPGVTVDPAAASPFDGLRPIRVPDPVDGPLVSVIMSAFRPGPEILTSARSILDQSWTNLELLVIDDASGREYREVLDQVAALDPRVRVLIQAENRGTYGARNRALPETRGEFVTFQDSDDWSHPERLERQAQRLLDDPALPAVMSRSIRCTPDLELQLLGYRTTRPNVSSLMLRRSTIETLGFFDHVRKGADSEYELRIGAHYGRRPPVMPDLLAFVRLDANSLSRSDFKPGWWHQSRFAYRDGYRTWHRSIATGSSPWLSSEAAGRQFLAPRAFLRGTDHHHDDRPFDLLFVADWREVGAAQSALLQQIRAASSRGDRIGIMHLESLRALEVRSDGLCREIGDLQIEGVVTRVLPDESFVAMRLLLGDPSLLNHAPARMADAEVRRVTVLAFEPPRDARSSGVRYAPALVNATAASLWGVDPEWVPGSEDVRAALAHLGGARLAPADFAGCHVAQEARPARTRRARPIIGAAVGLGEDLVPDTPDAVLALFPDDDRFDVRLIAWPPRLAEMLGRVPGRWLVFRPDEITQRDLHRQLDFFVSPTGADREDQVIPRVIDAVSAGAIAVVPRSFERALGGAAVYADGDEVSREVRRLFADPDEFAARLADARTALRDRFAGHLAQDGRPGADSVGR